MRVIIEIIFPVLFAAIGGSFLFTAGKVIVQKRPIVSPVNRVFRLMLFVFLLLIVVSAYDLLVSKHANDMSFALISLFFQVAVLCVLWRQAQGYMVVGITAESMREGLHFALKEVGEEFEEALTKIKLLNSNTELDISIQSWMGVGEIRIKNKDKRLLGRIVDCLSDYYCWADVKPNYLTSIHYIIFGVLMLAMAVESAVSFASTL